MNVIVTESEAFEELKLELKQYVKQALKEVLLEKQQNESSDWITIEDAKKLLPYSSKTTWQKFRDEGVIAFSQNGRNIMPSRKSISSFLKTNAVWPKEIF
jgi:hypothetical protein